MIVHLLKLGIVKQEGPRVEEATGESLGGGAVGPSKRDGKVSQGGAVVSSCKVREKGASETGSGVSLGQAAAAHCSPGGKSCEDP